MMKKKGILICLTLLLCGCGVASEEQNNGIKTYSATTFAMDTVMDITLYEDGDGEQHLIDVEQEIRRLEGLFSGTIAESEISQINASAGKEAVPISEDTQKILEQAIALNKLTDGAYDITISPIVKAWGFTTEEEKHVPPADEIAALLQSVSIDNLVLDAQNHTAYLKKEGMAIDLGGIAKGYTSDVVAALLKEKGVESAILPLGGNVVAVGRKPDQSLWKVAVGNPIDANDYIGMLQLEDSVAITSNGFQRYFEENGKHYHHIIDPQTGYPADNDLLSVTIVSANGTKADGLSTALFVMGYEKAVELWRSCDDFEAVFVTTDGRVIATEGLAERFIFEGRDNDFRYETVAK